MKAPQEIDRSCEPQRPALATTILVLCAVISAVCGAVGAAAAVERAGWFSSVPSPSTEPRPQSPIPTVAFSSISSTMRM